MASTKCHDFFFKLFLIIYCKIALFCLENIYLMTCTFRQRILNLIIFCVCNTWCLFKFVRVLNTRSRNKIGVEFRFVFNVFLEECHTRALLQLSLIGKETTYEKTRLPFLFNSVWDQIKKNYSMSKMCQKLRKGQGFKYILSATWIVCTFYDILPVRFSHCAIFFGLNDPQVSLPPFGDILWANCTTMCVGAVSTNLFCEYTYCW